MSWIHKRGKTFHLGFRFGGRVFRLSLRTDNERIANSSAARVDENIRLVETGRLLIPDDCNDIATFLLSDGKLDAKPAAPKPVTLPESVLKQWFENHHPGSKHAFCAGAIARSRTSRTDPAQLSVSQAHGHLKRTLKNSKWSSVRGWHVLRHTFASNCAAKCVDQRLINSWMGHQTEEMMKRCQHLKVNDLEFTT